MKLGERGSIFLKTEINCRIVEDIEQEGRKGERDRTVKQNRSRRRRLECHGTWQHRCDIDDTISRYQVETDKKNGTELCILYVKRGGARGEDMDKGNMYVFGTGRKGDW